MGQEIELRLAIDADVLRITIVNRSEQDLQFWIRDSSWGWSIFSLLLAKPGSDQWSELTAKPVRWTRNVPRAKKVVPGGELDYELQYENPSWEGLEDINAWLDQPFLIRVRLRIRETPEAIAQDVFIGEALSAPSQSLPPHSWLTGDKTS